MNLMGNNFCLCPLKRTRIGLYLCLNWQQHLWHITCHCHLYRLLLTTKVHNLVVGLARAGDSCNDKYHQWWWHLRKSPWWKWQPTSTKKFKRSKHQRHLNSKKMRIALDIVSAVTPKLKLISVWLQRILPLSMESPIAPWQTGPGEKVMGLLAPPVMCRNRRESATAWSRSLPSTAPPRWSWTTSWW